MSVLELFTRSFHPDSSFGLGGFGFHGDNRGFSTDTSVTSRIEHHATINLKSSTLSQVAVRSNRSSHPFGMVEDYQTKSKQPTGSTRGQITPYRPDGDQAGDVLVDYRGQNFAMPLKDIGLPVYSRIVPDLDVMCSIAFHINRSAFKFHVTCRMVGDGFPNAECFMIDSEGKALFLASHIRVGAASGQLFGNRKIAMYSGALEVDWTGSDTFGTKVKCHFGIDYSCDCSPTDIKALMKANPSTLDTWNGLHTGRNASGGKVRQFFDELPFARDPGTPAHRMP